MSPEMLKENQAHYASDLWALGCIIYQCLTGVPPFRGSVEQVIFDSILEKRYSMPADLPEDAIDLIQALLKLNPLDRLGSGPAGSDLSMEKLKAHPFFEGLEFDNLHKKSPPIQKGRMGYISEKL